MPKREIADSDSEDDFGPMPAQHEEQVHEQDSKDKTAMIPKKKLKKLEFEEVYLKNLPSAEMYERSYMHRDVVTHVAVSKATEFIITGSIDGHVKFWKKLPDSIEFVKHFQAHLGPILSLELSTDGRKLVTISVDRMIKFFDVQSFDMSHMISAESGFTPSTALWLPRGKVAVADADSPTVKVFAADSTGAQLEPMLVNCHTHPVCCMSLHPSAGVVVSADIRGVIEYWIAETGEPASRDSSGAPVSFLYKSETDLYALAKARTVPCALVVSPTGDRFVVTSRDKQLRVFDFASGRMRLQLDESAASYAPAGGNSRAAEVMYEPYELGRRMATERELEAQYEALALARPVFDESGHFLLYSSLAGLKVFNLHTGRLSRSVGHREGERFIALALYQGAPRVDTQFMLSRAGPGAEAKTAELLNATPALDPTVIATSFKKRRFYCFSTREPSEVSAGGSDEGRDVLNEAPTEDERSRGPGGYSSAPGRGLSREAVLHTSLGDIRLKLFPDDCPRTVENFTTHARNGYYDGVVFHRVIKGFMVQTGDPLGDGTGGESIWGGEFGDEFSRTLRHDRPYTVSMANAGPDTNGSQFFVTTVPTPWLDNKHTVFGRVSAGFEVVGKIEAVKVNKHDRPLDEIKIISIEIL